MPGAKAGGLREVRDRRRQRIAGRVPADRRRLIRAGAASSSTSTAGRAATRARPRPRRGLHARGESSTRRRGRSARATNNVAEYRGLLLGLERARALGATEVDVVNDSELVARQISGAYKVKHPDMRPLYLEAMEALRGFERWSVRSVPRAQNARRRRARQPGARCGKLNGLDPSIIVEPPVSADPVPGAPS